MLPGDILVMDQTIMHMTWGHCGGRHMSNLVFSVWIWQQTVSLRRRRLRAQGFQHSSGQGEDGSMANCRVTRNYN
jgi:hypothetical protein